MSTTRTTKTTSASDTKPHTDTAVPGLTRATVAATPAGIYQQLQAHLATLRLHDAAEALPTVLDAAAADGLSLTAASTAP